MARRLLGVLAVVVVAAGAGATLHDAGLLQSLGAITGLMSAAGPPPAGGTPTARGAAAAPRPEPVTVATVRPVRMPLELTAVGTVQASATVTIRPRIEGEVTGVHFREGETVAAGALLFTLDSRGPEVEVRQAEAAVARGQALLANARRELVRFEKLATENAASRQRLDEARTTVAEREATTRSDEAKLAGARLQLGYTRITAPMQGRTGATGVDPGNVVKAGDAIPLVVIRRTQPIEVVFSLPQKALAGLRAALAAGPVPVTARVPGTGGDAPGRPAGGPSVDGVAAGGNAGTDGETGILETGRLSFIEGAGDPTTGTIGLKAVFANPAERLWPGQVVDVLLTLREDEGLTVPAQAVLTGQQGSFVFVTRPAGDGKASGAAPPSSAPPSSAPPSSAPPSSAPGGPSAHVRAVTVIRSRQGLALIGSGLGAGERVVVEGHFRLTDGAPVAIKGTADAGPDDRPTPVDRPTPADGQAPAAPGSSVSPAAPARGSPITAVPAAAATVVEPGR